ncbi:DUF1697 domain-containing protein [Chryseobacterium koreense]|uniref:Pyridoxamine 5-phosphate oxidase n=1 Tax=Chryseobacterium koreense CCUG 49689 TaxID=1304281 RepID=A0A0J7LR91_9FLAO|nr:DUF1697 domain-containing protein [Chryseobacterium koreense]KMQ71525.1 hypothetical protein ACM44_06795 [Chryseobacterium koreense CCUG 49689]MBB5333798.1 uncharacterized protein (DUF1697 family) [Chryseobacterium koreense]
MANRFCAFLRGVNVNGTSMKMAEVCKVFSDAGMEEVTFVLATGNILFYSPKNALELKGILEKSMSEHFKYEAFLFIKTKEELEKIFDQNPFEPSPDNHIYVFLGVENIENVLWEEFQKSDAAENENGKIVGNTFYWKIPKGNTLGSSFGKILGKKSLKAQMTSRNINTFEKILKKI